MRCLWSSTPVITGMLTSAIKQAVSPRRGEARKSAAERVVKSVAKLNDASPLNAANVSLKRFLIPAAEMPQDTAAIYARSAELLKKYPRDPRVRHFAAMSLANAGDLAGAEQQMRIGLAEKEIISRLLVPTARAHFEGYLALILNRQHRKDEAREFARSACQDTAPALATTRTLLIKSGLCETAKP